MNEEILKAYKSLVPADQLVIDAMIVALFKKDKQIRDVTSEVHKYLTKQQAEDKP